MWQLTPIPKTDIRKHWYTIVPGLVKVMEKGNAEWIPEDVYMDLCLGNSVLYMGRLDGKYVGFTILKSRPHPSLPNETQLLIWITYSKDPMCTMLGLGDVLKLAKDNKFHSAVMYSPRKGWVRKLEPFGFKVTEYRIEKVINE